MNEKKTKKRRQIKRNLPEIGKRLQANYKGKRYMAEIVPLLSSRHGRGVKVGNKVHASLSGAARFITGHHVNGWKFWEIVKK